MCSSGACVYPALECPAPNKCQLGEGVCDTATGQCSYEKAHCTPPSPCHETVGCDPDSGCLFAERLCAEPNACQNSDGYCDTTTGECSYTDKVCPPSDDACLLPACDVAAGGCTFVQRDCGAPPNSCLQPAGCSPASGCLWKFAEDGVPCTEIEGGKCSQGQCLRDLASIAE